MNNSEKLCLKWNDFTENISSAFRELRKDSEFTDVTLAFKDGQMEAHKVILASASPFFNEIFTRNKHQHPLIYMKDLKTDDFVSILDFLYFGEANVFQDNLDSFLGLANELKLKGLMGNPGKLNEGTVKDDLYQKIPRYPQERNPPEQHNAKESDFTKEERIVAISNHSISSTNEDLDQQIKSMMSKGPVILEGSQRGRTSRICNVCGKEGTITGIINHIESSHITGVSHTCDTCGKINRSRHALMMHKRTNHTQVLFSEQEIL